MKLYRVGIAVLIASLGVLALGASPSASSSPARQDPTWWQKGQWLINNQTPLTCSQPGTDFSAGSNVDISNELTAQSETSIAINPNSPSTIVAGSNEIFCLPMAAFASTGGGAAGTWTLSHLPLPPPLSMTGQDFGSDPGVAWDTLGNVYYSYIVVFFNRSFHAITGTEMAVARSTDRGHTWTATFFNENVGTGKFNDKPMITVDTNPSSPHFNTVYVAWDNASNKQGKSSNNDVVLLSRSSDHGVTFSTPVQVSPSQGGQAGVIGADPFVGLNGTLFVAWTDGINPAIRVATSTDGGQSFGPAHLIANTLAVVQTTPPAQALRGALIYPACAADSTGLLYCSWTDANAAGFTRLFESRSHNGATWSAPRAIDDATANDQFNQWLTVDPKTNNVVLSWYDTRNESSRALTEVFFTESKDHGATFAAASQVATSPTNETLTGADLGNQYGDYEGISAFNGVVQPVWTDRRASIAAVLNLDEEVFTETIHE